MCPSCYEIEFPTFATNQEWADFDLLLTLKLGSNKIRFIEFIDDRKRHKDDGIYIYECLSCNQKWKLRDPDGDNKGSFVALN